MDSFEWKLYWTKKTNSHLDFNGGIITCNIPPYLNRLYSNKVVFVTGALHYYYKSGS